MKPTAADNQNDRMTRREFLSKAAATTAAAVLWQAGRAPAVLAASREPVKVGVLLPYTGEYSVLADRNTKGLTLYFERIGWQAGGRKIELVQEDDENSPQVGLRKIRKLIERDRVDFLTGFVGTHVTYAVRDTIHRSRVPTITNITGATDIVRKRKSPYIFKSNFTWWQLAHPMGQWIKENLGGQAYASGADYGAGHEVVDFFKAAYEKAGGRVVGEFFAPLGTTDYSPYVTQMGQSEFAASFSFFAGSDAVRFVQQFAQYGLKEKARLTGVGYLLDDSLLKPQGEAALGGLSTFPWAPRLDNPANHEFVNSFRERFDEPASLDAMTGYDAAHIIAGALEALDGDVSDRDALVEAIKAVRFDSPRGPFRFDPETNNPIENIYLREVQRVNGELTNVVVHTFEDVRDPGA